jgi:RND family efflux transporter MFP subunit
MTDQLSSDLASLRIDRDVDPNRRGPLFYIGVTALVAAVAAAIWVFGLPYLESKVFKKEIAVTEVSQVSAAHASIDLTTTGYVMPQRISQVAAKAYGKVSKVFIRQGQKVKENDVLLELDAIDQEASIASARARAAAARARVATAKASVVEVERQAQRAKSLAESGVGPKAAAEDLETRAASLKEQVNAAQAEVNAAQAEVAALQVGLKNLVVRAPIEGTVISKPPEVGENLGLIPGGFTSQSGTIEIADLTTLVVETDVPEQRLHLVQIGRHAEIVLDAFPDRRYRGKAIEIVPRVNRSKATATVKVAFVDPNEGVLPDMSARVSFLTKELDQQALKAAPKLVVPASALADRGGAKVVFVIDGDRVRMTPVTLAGPNGSGFELKSGPGPGTRVVRDPPPDLGDGQLVKEKSDG